MNPLFGTMGLLFLLVISSLCYSYGRRPPRCLLYEAEKTPLTLLEGDWFVQDYAHAGGVFENQTCVKLSFYVDRHGNAATFNKTWIDKWSQQIQYRELLVMQNDPAGIVFLNSNDPSWEITSRILRFTNDGTFIHSSCELIGHWIQSQRITTATRKRQVAREDWLKVYDSLGKHVFQDHAEVPQQNCFN